MPSIFYKLHKEFQLLSFTQTRRRWRRGKRQPEFDGQSQIKLPPNASVLHSLNKQEKNAPFGLYRTGRFAFTTYAAYLPCFSAACAAARRAIGTRKGEQDT